MNLLIVDDQQNVLIALTSSIEWNKYGIDSVYTASSVLTAKKIIETKDVHILMSDIEMPVENGISLIQWIRSKTLPIECILLTSHADFIYAKQAISLGVLDYVLQPATNEDIIRSVSAARDRILAMQAVNKDLQINQFSTVEMNYTAKRFLENWPINNNDEIFENELQRRIDKLNSLGLPCHKDDFCFLLTMRIDAWYSLPPAIATLRNQFDKILTTVFSFINGKQTPHYLDENHFVSLLVVPTDVDLENYLDLLSSQLRQELNCAVSIYYTHTSFRELNSAYQYMSKTEDLFDSSQTAVIHKVQPPKHYVYNNQISGSYKKYFEQIDNYITENISLPFTRSELAEAIHVSPDYVSHIVRLVANCSYKELITRKKMEYAKRLIKTTDQPIGNIAIQCGYDSFAYFSKVYKSINNVSPSQDRNTK